MNGSEHKPQGFFNPLSSGKLRNDPCPCGSGKKIKKCHGVESTLPRDELALIRDMINNFNKRFSEAIQKNAKAELERLSKGDLSDKEETTNNI